MEPLRDRVENIVDEIVGLEYGARFIRKRLTDAILQAVEEDRAGLATPKADKRSDWHSRWMMTGDSDAVHDAECDSLIADLRRSEAREAALVAAGKAVCVAYLKSYGYMPGVSTLPQEVLDFNAALASTPAAPKAEELYCTECHEVINGPTFLWVNSKRYHPLENDPSHGCGPVERRKGGA